MQCYDKTFKYFFICRFGREIFFITNLASMGKVGLVLSCLSMTPLMVMVIYGNGNGLLFHMTQPTSRSTVKAIACSKPTISEHQSK